MSLGILNNVSAIYAENNLNNTQASLQKVLQQLSSGARINSGADDAAGLAIANGLKANENALTQSAQNASDAIGLLSTADGALSQVTNLLDRAVTLATEAANGTLSSNQVSSANQEYQSIITEIGYIGSTTNFNGNNVFSSTATSFYVGDGTSTGSNNYSDVTGALGVNSVGQSAPSTAGVAATPTLATNANATISTGTNTTAGDATHFAVETYAFNNANDTLNGTINFTQAGSAGVTATATIAAGSTLSQAATALTSSASFIAAGLVATVNGASLVVTQTQAQSVNATSVTVPGTSIVDTHVLATNQATFAVVNASDTLSGTLAFQQGATNASINFQPGTTISQAIAAINASGSTFQLAGVTALAYSAGATSIVLTNGTVTSQGAQATNVGTTLLDAQATTAIVNVTGTTPSGAGSVVTFGALLKTTDDIVGTLKVAVGVSGSPIAVQFQPGTTLSAAVSQINNNAQLKAAGITAGVSSPGVLQLTGPTGTGSAFALQTTGSVLYDAPATPTAGVGTDFTNSNLSTLTTASAQNVLTGVNAAIANVSYQRGILGAYSNQLTAASNTAASENVNLTSAESSIRSTNYGQATSDLAKYEVLSQTGISALAQANSVQQEILKLLQ